MAKTPPGPPGAPAPAKLQPQELALQLLLKHWWLPVASTGSGAQGPP